MAKLKRYLLFSGWGYYPSGGWDDFVGSFDTIEEAAGAERFGDWFQIVDSETSEEIDR